MRKYMPIFVIIIALLLAGCANAAPTVAPAGGTPQATAASTVAPVDWQADGVISEGEYPHQTTLDSVDLFWRNDGTHLYLAMRAKTIAWLGIGLDPENRMQGANFILGAVVDGKAVVEDDFGTGPTAHAADTTLGGTDDIIAFGGSQTNGVTVWEAQIPLDSGDAYDKALTAGQTVPFLVATGSSADFSAVHSFRAHGELTLDN